MGPPREAAVYVFGRSPLVRVAVLYGCFVGGRRARPGDRRSVPRSEAALLVRDGLVDILPEPRPLVLVPQPTT